MLRRAAIVIALTIVAASCSTKNTPSALDGATTTVAGQPAATAAGGQPAPSPQRTTRPGRPATTLAPNEVPEASPNANGSPGSAAPLFLRPLPATTLVVEVSAENGAAPRSGTISHVTNVLGSASKKSVETSAGRSPSAHEKWTGADLRAAADATAATTSGGGRAVIHLLFVHGQWASDDHVLGISVRGDVAAIFSDAVADSADPLVGAGAIEVAVTTHEVGHLLGLVDLYLNTGRDDPDHPGHSTDKESVMYWAVESTLVTDLLTGGPPRDFDDADRADLASIRGGV